MCATTSALIAGNAFDFVNFTGSVEGGRAIERAAAGTFTPQYTLSAAPGGAYSTMANSYFLIYPIGSAGLINVGTWA